jgi:general secretion pathway protein L
MNKYLVLRFTSIVTPVTAQWAIVDANGHLQQRGEQALADVRNSIHAEQIPTHCILLVPNEKVRITQVRIPTTNLAKIRQALPFAVEELIAEELETTHLATGDIRRNNNGLIDVAIVRHQLIIEWIDLCHQFDLTPQYIFPDGLCIPWEVNSWSFFLDHDRVLVRSDHLHAQASSLSLSAILLNEMVQTSNNRQNIAVPPQINFYATESDLDTFKQWRASLAVTPNHDQRDSLFHEDIFEVMAMQSVTHVNELINLRQGGYRVPIDNRSDDKSWRKVAVVALVGCLLFAITCIGKGLWYNAKASAMEKKSVELYKDIYPQATRVFNPRRQMETAISNFAGGGNVDEDVFIDSMVDITKLIASNQSSEVAIQSLTFDANKPDDMTMSMLVEQEDALDEMRQRLAETNLRFTVSKTTPNDNGVLVDFSLLRGQ